MRLIILFVVFMILRFKKIKITPSKFRDQIKLLEFSGKWYFY